MDKAELYDEIARRKGKSSDLYKYVPGTNGRVEKCAELVFRGELANSGSLLDVGGGIGDLGYILRDRFDERWVVDISWQNADAARTKGNSVETADIDSEGLPFTDGKFDLVAALDFIEHVVDPESFAREAYRVLKPGGDVFINTPNIRYWKHLEYLAVGGRFPHTSGDREVYHGGHLAFFTYLDLVEIFEKAGFRSFKRFKDEEGYENPSERWLALTGRARSREEYVEACMELGNPNLLFKASKE